MATSPCIPPLAGTVSFYDGTALLGTEPATGGVATLNVGTLSSGVHNFSATFSGDEASTTSESANIAVQTDGPRVMVVQRYGFHAQATSLVINSNGSVSSSSAQDLAHYVIVGPGQPVAVAR